MTLFDEPRSQGAARLQEIAASLTEMGWTTHLHRTHAGTDLTAILRSPGQRDVQVIADEDGYTELRYWASLSSPPLAAAAAIAHVLDAIMASQSLAKRAGPTQGPVAGYDGAVTERAEGAGMTGPHDHLAEQGRIPDQARPREADNPRDSQVRPDDLQARLERLPLNHPSSPYRDDGSRKPSPPDLTQYELPLPDEQGNGEQDLEARLEPLTDAEYATHVQHVRERLNEARVEKLATNESHTIDPKRQVWSEERVAIHDSIVEDLYQRAADVPCERRAIIAGGLPGAGKSTILDSYAHIDRSQFLTLDPDEIKTELARRGLIPSLEGLSPMEASDLVHEESSRVTKMIAARAQADGKNLIWDITMSSQPSTERRISDLRAHGYNQVEGIFVDIPPNISEARTEARHRNAQEDYRNGQGLGGRFIPPELIRSQTDAEWGSVNRRTFEAVKTSFDAWTMYDNSVDARPPILMSSSEVKKYDE
jgi:predicted kinase